MSRTYDISRDRERLNAWYPPFAPLPAETRTRRVRPVRARREVGRAPSTADARATPISTAEPSAEQTGTVAGPTQTDTAPTLEAPPPWLTAGTPTDAKLRRPTRTLAAAALTLIAAGGVAVLATNSERATASPATAAPAPAATHSWCPSSPGGDTVTGNGRGGQQDGPSAILAFDYAYYVLRSGEQARAMVAPGAETVSSAQVIQAAIDTAIPPGTEHCLAIVADPTEVERYRVTLTERRPDSTLENYQQIVTTADQGGRHFITSIGAAE